MRDPYSVLGLTKQADSGAIKSAYRRLAKAHHPDSNPDDPKAKERFSEISAAYDILGDADKRKQFDRGEIDADGNPTMTGFNPFGGARAGRAQGGPNAAFDDLFAQFHAGQGGGGFRPSGFGGSGGGGGAEDIFNSIFGAGGPQPGMNGRGGPRQAGGQTRKPSRGADVQATVTVTLDDILKGDKVTVSLPGAGAVKVALPKGVTHGQVIRLKGKGSPSNAPGGQPGDARITVRVAPHANFRAEGTNLLMDLPVTLDEAVLGARISVETLDGTVALSLPEGTQSGRVMRLKGRGLPDSGGGRGDVLIKVMIKLPDDGDEALQTLMRRWRSTGRYSVR
ncbi:MAG: J domain-containing protein [Pseudomonadota bacterium]